MIKNYFGVLLCFMIILSACNNNTVTVKRYGMITGLRTDKVSDYKVLHAKVWPDVLKQIKACNIRNYSIYMKLVNGDWYLFSFLNILAPTLKPICRK